MNIQEACDLVGLDMKTEKTFDDMKKAFKKQALKFHPDHNPSGEHMMKLINNAYDFLKKLTFPLRPIERDENQNFCEKISKAVNAIIDLEGLVIEVCGSWVWVSGSETRTHKAKLKEAGFRWAAKKKMWSISPNGKMFKTKPWDMDKIRSTFGSDLIKRNRFKELN